MADERATLSDELVELLRDAAERCSRAHPIDVIALCDTLRAERETVAALRQENARLERDGTLDADLIEAAWGVISNAGDGFWECESDDWQRAAAKWRGRYHAFLDMRAARSSGETPT